MSGPYDPMRRPMFGGDTRAARRTIKFASFIAARGFFRSRQINVADLEGCTVELFEVKKSLDDAKLDELIARLDGKTVSR